MQQHLYETYYQSNKEMYIRFVKDGRKLETFKERSDRYRFIRAQFDCGMIDDLLRSVPEMNKTNRYIFWLAWGHKCNWIQDVGLGDHTWQKNDK